MNLETDQTILDEIRLDSEKSYLTLQLPFDELDIDEKKIFSHFTDELGSRYWFRSKDERYNSVGIGYLETIKRDKYSAEALSIEKDRLYRSIQHISAREGMCSRLSLFGGTRFDDKDTTDEWNDYAMVEFHLPKWQFDLVNRELFYSIRISDVDIESILTDIHSELKAIDSAETPAPEKPEINMEKDIFPSAWKQLVDQAVDVLNDEDFRKVVLARQRLITFKTPAEPLYLLKRLDDEEGTYTVYYEKNKSAFISKSPEKLFHVKDDNLITNAVAGSSERTGDVTRDEEQVSFLMADEKNRYEHELVRESIVSDLEPYSDEVKYSPDPNIMENKYIYHLHTPIEAVLNEKTGVFELLDAIHPTPAVGGLPKDKAREYIMAEEYGTRGLYAAPIGLIHEDNESEFVVAIRSMLVQAKSATLFAGCGIVKGSSSEKEFEETRVKFTPMLNVLEANRDESSGITD
ncbi:isochorismate synthase [Salinicoccus albus]|uniref:isochorismate synthase n=1 Tax=Salinicoccus albus TaxID=418756 RepID=UPI0003680C60|nr:isochorismate synthase [Salinicoccus albus]